MIQESLPGIAEETGKFRPRVRGAHIHNPDCFNPGLRRLDAKETRGLAALDASPELPLGGNNEVLVEWIGMGADFDPFCRRR
jgi:hypothetical protein